MNIPIPSTLAILLMVAAASAQATKVERRAYARMQELRLELAAALARADDAMRELVAARFAEPPSGNPFADMAEVLALSRGVEIDDAFRVRAGLLLMALPEVVDPTAITTLQVTVHAPRIVPDVGSCAFEVRLEGGGEVVRTASIDRQIGLEDLLRYRATVPIDVTDLPDGRYTVTVRTSIDGEFASGPEDVVLRATVHVLRGFKLRADALPMVVDGAPERLQHAAAIAARIGESRRDRDSHAILTGAVWQVERTYAAEPSMPGADPVVALERAEAILANLMADRAALDGLTGRVSVGFPLSAGGDGPADVGALTVELPVPDHRDPLPLVLLVPGAPAWDRAARRPLSPRSVAPQWALAQLDRGRAPSGEAAFFLAAIESPGRYRNAARAVSDAVAFLRRRLPVRDGAVFLIGEREGGYAVSRVALAAAGEVCGVVLVAGGGFSAAELGALGDTRVLAVPSRGHPSTIVLEWLARSGREGVEVLPAAGVPWPIALACRAAEIDAFVRR